MTDTVHFLQGVSSGSNHLGSFIVGCLRLSAVFLRPCRFILFGHGHKVRFFLAELSLTSLSQSMQMIKNNINHIEQTVLFVRKGFFP